jgi:CheY-like chemotaxis protein
MQALLMIKADDAVGGFFKKALEEAGHYSVALVRNGDEGIELARELAPAVVITDLFLPGIKQILELTISAASSGVLSQFTLRERIC